MRGIPLGGGAKVGKCRREKKRQSEGNARARMSSPPREVGWE